MVENITLSGQGLVIKLLYGQCHLQPSKMKLGFGNFKVTEENHFPKLLSSKIFDIRSIMLYFKGTGTNSI